MVLLLLPLVQSILVGPIWSRESKEKPGKARKVLKVAFQALLGWRRLRCNEISYTGQAAKADSCWVAALYALACLALVAALPPVAMLQCSTKPSQKMYCLASLVLVTDHAYLAVLGVLDVARFPFYVSQVTNLRISHNNSSLK